MKYILIIAVFLLSSCNRNIYSHFDYRSSKNPWITAFKDRVFFSALREAYKSDSSIFKLVEKKDALNPYDGLSLTDIKKADEIGKKLVENMPLPFMCEGCQAGTNYFMATSLHYYASQELDVIAKRLYKMHEKIDKKN